ncbi:hypothetical protein [Desulforamulus aquiferis]|uniref:Uncharacterized protein n=1 Tax=Desulforamulus aquiferis TaxID=1397668 RepID=A0AAW7ZH18_9FIRM|nr:hypothetical protein [Desulforamulus aquiferis]MDO7788331.1 hypothetical protein [Desulforamulus aquiferis]RYD06273.1 hypothetical protein N752_05115 [Desulforamulus aquiferis]
MQKQVVFPAFLGESEMAVVVVIPSIKEDMADIFDRFHSGEEVDYWFSWDLVLTDTGEYLVVLEVDWAQGDGLIVAFTTEMWEFLVLMVQKENLVIMADWNVLEEGAPTLVSEEEFKPYALLIRDVHTGLDKLYDQVKELVSVNDGIEELSNLQLLLEGTNNQNITLH